MQRMKEKTATRGGVRCVCTCFRAFGELEEVRYALWEEPGESRAEFGTPCERFYTLTVCSALEECRLVDIAREESEALAICMHFARLGVLPANADEVYEDFCLA